MKLIVCWCDQISERGTEVAMFDYAILLNKYLNINFYIVYDELNKLNCLKTIQKFTNQFCEKFITKTKFEKEIYRNLESFDNKFQFVINNGNYFKNLDNFKLIQLSVFANKPKTNAYKYLYVSKWVKNYSKFRYPFQYIKYKLSKKNDIHILPHILRDMGPKNNIKEIEKFKKKYNINKNLFLVGRYGGYDSFDIPFVKEAIKEILRNDKNIFFIFCNTEPFIIDQRVRFIDKLIVDKDKSLFLDSIDLFLHARNRGETFGLSIYEALNRGIPVISYSKSKERNHIFDIESIDCLYNNKFQLIQLLKNKKRFLDLKNTNLWFNKFKENDISQILKFIFEIS